MPGPSNPEPTSRSVPLPSAHDGSPDFPELPGVPTDIPVHDATPDGKGEDQGSIS